MKTTQGRKGKAHKHFRKKNFGLALGICLAVLASAYITNARYSADSSLKIPTGSCVRGSDRLLMPTYKIRVVDANRQGIANKKIIVRAPLFAYNPDKKTWNDPASEEDYVENVGTILTDRQGDASISVPYCTVGSKYYLGTDNSIFRSINFYLENMNLPGQNIDDFFTSRGDSISGIRKIVNQANLQPVIFTVYN